VAYSHAARQCDSSYRLTARALTASTATIGSQSPHQHT